MTPSSRHVLRSILTPLVAAVLLSACAPGPSATPSSAPPATSAPTASPAATAAPTATPGPTATPEPTPAPEKHLGLLSAGGVTGSGASAALTIDYVELYTGLEAVAKGAEDGVAIDGDFYVRNYNPALHAFAVAPGCIVRLLDPSGGTEASVVTDLAGLSSFLATLPEGQGVLFEIVTVGSSVTQILQFYTP